VVLSQSEVDLGPAGTVDRYAHGLIGAKGFAGRHLRLTITAVGRT
jgi:hypothetical protein